MQQGARPSLLAILPSSFKNIGMMLAESLLGVFRHPLSFHGRFCICLPSMSSHPMRTEEASEQVQLQA